MSPSPEEALLALALSKPAEKRAAFLGVVCEGDAALRQRLEALLSAHEQPETLLATQADAARPTAGGYKLARRWGHGDAAKWPREMTTSAAPPEKIEDRSRQMAKHSFQVTFTGAAEDTIAKARAGLEKQGGTLTGDGTKGDILASTPAGKVKGNYRVDGQTITMEITDKPFVVPASVIEGQVRKFLSS